MGWRIGARGLSRGAGRAVALAALALPFAGPAWGQCTSPTGDTGFVEINVNVAAGTFDRVLPFDVPIRLCGQVPLLPTPPAPPPAENAPPPAPAAPPTVTVQLAESKNPLSVDANCHILAPANAT